MLLAVNSLIEYSCKDKKVERVLWISPDNEYIYTIDINKNTCCAVIRMMSEIISEINNGYIKILQDDSFQRLVSEEDISEKDKRKRDKVYEIVKAILIEPDIYDEKKRRQQILKVSKENDVSNRVVYKYLQRYFQRGMNRNALLPDFYLCGGKGKERQYKVTPREGLIINEEIKRIFRLAIQKYYYSNRQNPLTVVYQLMIKDYFAEDFKYQNGTKIPLILEQNQIPTLNQFYYWFNKERNIKKEVSSRRSAKKYELNNRAILGNSTKEAVGPGSIYQVDATIADIYVVSSYNQNWIIGRPIVYICMDIFSRLITGVYVGLEGPSWSAGMMAIANAVMDKVQFCKEYGIAIENEEWPVSNVICDVLEADRGEWEGKVANGLIIGLNVVVKNTSSYRGDLKSIVERNFRTLNEKVKISAPGYINQDYLERGAKSYVLDAKLTVFQFTQIIIRSILYHNNHNWLKNYDREEMMIDDDVDCIPVKLWNWGIANRAGKLRTVTEEQVKLHLMKTEYASITGRGINLRGIFYSCKRGLVENWFEQARNFGSRKVIVSYDMRNMNFIYIKNEDGQGFEKCYLLEHQERYANHSLEEIMHLRKVEKLKEKNHEEQVLQNKVDLLSEIEAIVKEAEKSHELNSSPERSARKRIKGIRKARQIEKFINRKKEAFELGKEDNRQEAKVISINESNEVEEESIESIDLLRKKQKEKLQHGKYK